jgi:hypothetical protein
MGMRNGACQAPPGMAEGFAQKITTWITHITLAALLALPLTAGAVNVLLRFDDFTRDSEPSVENPLFDEAVRLGIPLLVGVVPRLGEPYPATDAIALEAKTNLGPEKTERLRAWLKSGDITVALHGYSHATNYMVNGQASEFAGLPFATQRRLLIHGKSLLESTFGVPVRVFIPPFNAYDHSTLRALPPTGFQTLSAARRGPIEADLPLAYLPGTTFPDQFRVAVSAALRHGTDGQLMIVVLHPYDFVESGESLPVFRKNGRQLTLGALLADLRWAETQRGLHFVSVGDLVGAEDLSGVRIAADARITALSESHWVLPPGLTPTIRPDVLPSRAEAERALTIEALSMRVFYPLLALVAWWTAQRLNRKWSVRVPRSWQRALAVGAGAIAVLLGGMQGFYFGKLAVLFVVAGWYLGTLRRGTASPGVP